MIKTHSKGEVISRRALKSNNYDRKSSGIVYFFFITLGILLHKYYNQISRKLNIGIVYGSRMYFRATETP